MGNRKWTDQQWDAVSARQGTVLVSAAAGSGKTSVLVERVIGLLTDGPNPIPADRLLIVTFTKAAAAEMKARVEAAVLARIKAQPGNKALRRQQLLVPGMHISTVDSFCSALVREFFYLLDIAPDFKIIADKQREELMGEALGQVLDEAFDQGMYDLADAFSTERSDDRLNRILLDLYHFTGSHLMPERWLEEKLALYDDGPVEESPWGRVLMVHMDEVLGFCARLTDDALRVMSGDEKLHKAFHETFLGDAAQISAAAGAQGWDERSRALQAISFGRMPSVRGYAGDPLKERISALRDTVKKSIKKLALAFADSGDRCREEIAQMRPIVAAMAHLVGRFSACYDQKKRERKLADYSDLEHWALRLLLSEETGVLAPSPLAKELSARFDQIMVDEYQDTNEVQDWIFRALSKEDGNKFMVGDVKQCIYSFRQAMPDIFLSYKASFARYSRENPQYPATVILDKNFRSRSTVIDSVNFVFFQLLSKSTGGIDYTDEEALVAGADYPEKADCETRLDFLEKDRDIPQEVCEARHIAGMIRQMIQSGFTVTEGGVQRPVSYRDFCILLRSANKYAAVYADEMMRLSVPAFSAVSRGFFASAEIQQALSFLQVVDNPNQDIPLLAVLMGPLYGFTPDDLAALRIAGRKSSVFISLLEDTTGKYGAFLEDIEGYRLLAAAMPSDEFLGEFYARTGFLNIALAMDEGENRRANLRRLQEYARDYESAGYIGVSGFVRFVEKLKTAGSDLEGANLVSENADVVRVMSIHKSKGLEFPVCIVAGCGRRMNGETADVLLNSRLGLGVRLKDPGTGARFTNVVRDAVALQNSAEMVAEELRVLYVAMTRAKEKLVLVATVSDIGRALGRLSAQLDDNRQIAPYAVKGAAAMSDWLLLCALRHPDGNILRSRAGVGEGAVVRQGYTPWDIRLVAGGAGRAPEEKPRPTPAQPDPLLLEQLRRALDFVYPQAQISRIPAKVTASALAEEKSGLAETLPRPAFLSAQGLTPAERGTALHSFMQFSNFRAAAQNPEAERDRLVLEGYISALEGRAVNMQRVRAFFASEIGRRIACADTVMKEQRFAVEIPASMVQEGLPPQLAQTPVLLQGSVDCAFTEKGKLYIVDFKTDRVESDQALADSYGVQLQLYARALQAVKNMPVGGCCLYSLYRDRQIAIDLPNLSGE